MEPRAPATGPSWAQACKECGQAHGARENHLYEYQGEVDDELVCHICLQPLLRPVDTPCGHTYCYGCLGSFLREQDFCPVDRQRLQLQQCRPSSLLVRNLLDKLTVLCPYQPQCQQPMQRCELQPHLENRCPGFRKLREDAEKRKRPSWNELKGSRGEAEIAPDHKLDPRPEPGLVNPAFEESEDEAPHRCSLVAETNIVEIFRDEPKEELGLFIVGGKDTPLGNIVIQDVHRDSLAARDGKLAPGDHILEVNDVSVASVTHACAVAVLRRPCAALRLVVMQERGFSARNLRPEHHPAPTPAPSSSTVTQVTLMKRDRSEPLGIKLIRKSEEPGVFVLDLLAGGLAAKDGKLRSGDKVLAINGHDLRHGSPESAAQIIQASEVRVNFVVMRRMEPPGEGGTSSEEGADRGARRNPDQYFKRCSTYMKDAPGGFSSKEKTVSVKKEPRVSLGITIAGGRDTRSRVPVYITSVQPVGCLHRDGIIKAGDVLLGINGVDLTQLAYQEAVTVLKAQASQASVALHVVETSSAGLRDTDGEEGDREELEALENPCEEDVDWAPLWTRWLGLPGHLHWCRDIVLHKANVESWGFSIVGGYEESRGQQPFFIKTIVPGTPAHTDGRLKCGDEIVAVNGASTVGMNNSSLIPLLKLQKNTVTLTVVSWPGSLV